MKTAKELLKIKGREWKNEDKLYDYLLVVPSRLKHYSGFMRIAIIGVIGDPESDTAKMEACAWPDDIHWKTNGFTLQTDCYYPQGVLRFWTRGAKFKVEMLTFSIDIELVEE